MMIKPWSLIGRQWLGFWPLHTVPLFCHPRFVEDSRNGLVVFSCVGPRGSEVEGSVGNKPGTQNENNGTSHRLSEGTYALTQMSVHLRNWSCKQGWHAAFSGPFSIHGGAKWNSNISNIQPSRTQDQQLTLEKSLSPISQILTRGTGRVCN